MSDKPLFTPTAYDIQPAGVLILLASEIHKNPGLHKNGRLQGHIGAMVTAARACASADHATLGSIFEPMHKGGTP